MDFVCPLAPPVPIATPSGHPINATHSGDLILPGLPPAARNALLVPTLASRPLLSIATLCDAGCSVTFTAKNEATILHDSQPPLRCPRDPLWEYPTSSPAAPSLHNLSLFGTTASDLVTFAHACFFSPALKTLQHALDHNYIRGFPGLTSRSLRQHPPTNLSATYKGHLDQSRRNQRSTRRSPSQTSDALPHVIPDDNDDDDDPETPAAEPTRTHAVFTATFEPLGKMYSDMTGKFTSPSSSGNNYILIVYDQDSNSIQALPMKSRSKTDHLAALRTSYTTLVQANCRPRLHFFLDNECSDLVRKFMKDEHLDYQLVPPDVHRRNAAERAIRTFKNHFVAGLCSTHPEFPIHLWDKLLPQATLTLNLLCGSRLDPTISAHEQLFGPCDFNRTPLAPPGCKVLIHEKPTTRGTWAPHASDGWYIGPALESYRCFSVYSCDTRRIRTSDTVQFLPHSAPVPVPTPEELIQASLQDILAILTATEPELRTPSLSNATRAALQQLAETFGGPSQPAPPAPHQPLEVRLVKPDTSTDPVDCHVDEPPILLRQSPPVTPLRVTPASPHPSASLRVVSPPSSPATRSRPAIIPDEPATITPRRSNIRAPVSVRETPAVPAPNTSQLERHTGRASRNERRRQSRLARKPPSTTPDVPTTPTVHTYRTRQTQGRPRKRYGNAAAANLQLLGSTLTELALHGNAFNPDTGAISEYPELSASSDGPKWQAGNVTEIRRLLLTETIKFIRKSQVPRHKRATYLRVVCAYRPEKDDPYRVRWTVGGNLIEYLHDASTKTADLTTVKCCINSVLSTELARFITADIKDFYLVGTPLADPEYMKIHRRMIPQSLIDELQLETLFIDDHIYVKINKGMYGLPQAGRIANDYLRELLAPAGYEPVPFTPGLWKHQTRPISFVLVVDDFGIKFVNRADVDHLFATLCQRYEIKVDETGSRYCGLTLQWDYQKRTCDVSLPRYVERALQRFVHPIPAKPEDSPYRWSRPDYGSRIQYAKDPDTTNPIDPVGKKFVQEVIGVFLFYARAVDLTMLPALNSLAAQQNKPTQRTIQQLTQFLNYAASNPSAVLQYRASDMILSIESDCSYLSEPEARSRWAGYHFLAKTNTESTHTKPNAPIHVPCQILKEIVSSAAKGELAAVFHNARDACPIRTCLEELGHPQPATPIITDNTTAIGIAKDTVKQKCSKAMDMRFFWIRDRVRQGQFHIQWRKGSLNRADYMTKHHPASHHRRIRSAYLHDPAS